jgi:hypothetical protein
MREQARQLAGGVKRRSQGCSKRGKYSEGFRGWILSLENGGFMRNILIIAVLLSLSAFSQAQSTAFTYQGKLTDAGAPASGTYLMQFSLWDAASGGNQVGQTLTYEGGLSNGPAVQVTNGIFTVELDFGNPSGPTDPTPRFDGSPRWIQIAVRKVGEVTYTPLTPRQPITSTPYSIKSLNASTADTATNSTQLGGVVANQYVTTIDSRLSDARSPIAGSANYIQNGIAVQTSSNFNISGDGTAGGTVTGNIVNAITQYNLGGIRALSVAGTNNLFAGINSGQNNTGDSNAFFGRAAGGNNTTGSRNSYFGNAAGANGTTGIDNSYFGDLAGLNSSGSNNAFFGSRIGQNTTGGLNSFFGSSAGFATTSGNNDSFFGFQAGSGNTTGTQNAFFGMSAGGTNTTGSNNTAVGFSAELGNGNLTNATAIGANAQVDQSNSLVLGNNANVGIGTGAPLFKLHVIDSTNTGLRVQTNQTGGTVASFGGNGVFQIDSPGLNGGRLKVFENGDIWMGFVFGSPTVVSGGSISAPSTITGGFLAANNLGGNGTISLCQNSSKLVSTCSLLYVDTSTSQTILGTKAFGFPVELLNLGSAGSTALCLNAAHEISTCSSSLRYKTNIGSFSPGISLIRQLRPITFNWKQGGMKDVGFGAEDVAKINSLFVTYNDKGEVEGVKYDRLSVAFVNAFKEQQTQIERQQKEIDELKQIVNSLKTRINSRGRVGYRRH